MTKNLSKIPRFARNDIRQFILSFTIAYFFLKLSFHNSLCIMNYELFFKSVGGGNLGLHEGGSDKFGSDAVTFLRSEFFTDIFHKGGRLDFNKQAVYFGNVHFGEKSCLHAKADI